MKKKYVYLLLTLAGSAISFYGNKKVLEAVREEISSKLFVLSNKQSEFDSNFTDKKD
jgi:hypothetical protein